MTDISSEEKGTIESKLELKDELKDKIKLSSLTEEPLQGAEIKDLTGKSICGINLKREYDQLKCTDENLYSKECNKFMLKKEFIENQCLMKTQKKIVHCILI